MLLQIWPSEFIADLALSSGQQAYNILTKRQNGWDNNQLIMDLGVNLAIGEGVVGKYYRMSKSGLEAYVQNSTEKRAFKSMMDKDEAYSEYSPGGKAWVLDEMMSAREVFLSHNPTSVGDEMIKNIYNIFRLKETDIMGNLRQKSLITHNYDASNPKINPRKDNGDLSDEALKKVFDPVAFASRLDLKPEEIRKIVANRKNFGQFLKRDGYVISDSKEISLPAINQDQFQNAMGDLYQAMASRKNLKNKGILKLLESPDFFFRHPLDNVPEGSAPNLDSEISSSSLGAKVLSKPTDYAIFDSLLKSNKFEGLNRQEAIFGISEWAREPGNLDFIKSNAGNQENIIRNALESVAKNKIDAEADADNIIFPTRQKKNDYTDFHKLGSYASKGSDEFLGSMILFQKATQNNPPMSEIMESLRGNGVNISRNKANRLVKNALEYFKNTPEGEFTINNAYIAKLAPHLEYAPSRNMTKGDSDLLFSVMKQKMDDVDPSTGIRTRFDTAMNRINIAETGYYVFDFAHVRNQLQRRGMTPDQIENSVKILKNVIKKNSEAENKRFIASATRKSEISKLNITNLTDDTIAVSGLGISKREIDAFVKDQMNHIRGDYDNRTDNFRRQFSINHKDFNGSNKITTKFPSARLAYSRSMGEAKSISKMSDILFSGIRAINDNNWTLNNKTSFLIDYSDESAVALKQLFEKYNLHTMSDIEVAAAFNGNPLLKKEFTDIIQDSLIIERIPNAIPPSLKRKQASKNAEMIGDSQDGVDGAASQHTRDIDSHNVSTGSEAHFNDIYKAAFKRQPALNDFHDINNYTKAKQLWEKQVFEGIKNRIDGIELRDLRDANALTKLAAKVKKRFFLAQAVHDFGRWKRERIDIFGEKPEINDLKNLIQGTYADKAALPKDVGNFIEEAYGKITQEILAKVPDKKRANTHENLSKLMTIARESELKLLMDSKSSILKDNILEELQRPLNWSNGKEVDFNLKELFEDAF